VWNAAAILQGEIDLEMTTLFAFDTVSALAEEHLARKMDAFVCYESVKDEHKVGDDWLTEKLRVCAKLRGKTVSAIYGEAFIINNYAPLNAGALATIANAIA